MIAALDKKESAFFSHSDPNTVEWFVNITEEGRKQNDRTKDY